MISLVKRGISLILKHPFVFLCCLVVLYFFPIIFQNQVFYAGDILTIYLPFKKFLFDSLGKRIFPLWNPNIFSGYPSFADMTLGTYYPPSFILFLFPTIKGVSFLMVFHFFISTYFMYKLGKLLKLSSTGALLSSVCYTFSGLLVNYIADPQRFFVVILYPLFFFTLLKAFEKQNSVWVVFCAFVLSLQLFAGHIQYVFIELLVCPLFIFLSSKKNIYILRLIILITVVFLGFIFSSIAVLPTLELIPYTTRTEIYKDISIQQSFSLNPLTLIRFLIGHFWGVRSEGSAWGTMDTSMIGYIGFIPLIIIALSFQRLIRNRNTLIFIIITLFSLFISFGTYLPFFQLFIKYIPIFTIFRNPMVFLAIYTFFISILTGFAVDFLEISKRSRKVLLVGFMGILTASGVAHVFLTLNKNLPYTLVTSIARIIGKTLSSFHTIEVDSLIASFILKNIVLIGILGSLTFWIKNKKILLLVVFVDLFFLTRSIFFTIDNSWLNRPNPIITYLRQNLGTYRYLSSSEVVPFSGLNDYYGGFSFQPPFAKEGVRLTKEELRERFLHEYNLLPPNFSAYYGLSTIDGYTSFVIKKYNDLFQKNTGFSPLYQKIAKYNPHILNPKSDVKLSKIDFSKLDLNDEILDQLGVKYLVVDRNLELKHHQLVYNEGNISIYKNNNVKSRILLLDESDRIIENPSIIKENANQIEIRTQKKGKLILYDLYYPGWKAFADGEELLVEPYEEIFRSVNLDKEVNLVTFIFQPPLFYLGALLSGVSLFSTAIYLIIQFQKRKC